MGYGALEGRRRLGRRHVEVLFGLLFRIVRQLVVIVGKLPGPRGVFLRWRDSLRFGQVGAMESFIPSAARMGTRSRRWGLSLCEGS